MSKLSNTQSHSQSKATWGDDRLERHNERYRVAFNASILSNSPKPWIITINCFIFVAHNARGIPRRTVAGAVIGKLHIPYHSCAFSAFLNLFASQCLPLGIDSTQHCVTCHIESHRAVLQSGCAVPSLSTNSSRIKTTHAE